MAADDAVDRTAFLQAEAIALLAAFDEERLAARLLGGMAIRLLLGERLKGQFSRRIYDLDLFARRGEGRDLERILAARGWVPAANFNALNGGQRLLFHETDGETQVDVFLDVFEMCHQLPLRNGLDARPQTLSATDLLMTKLQIVEVNAKDRRDMYALLVGCDVADGDPAAIEPGRMADLTGNDWGLQHTFELNLAVLRENLDEVEGEVDRDRAQAAIAACREAIDSAPKSRGWKLRSRIGERKRWYELPEEVRR